MIVFLLFQKEILIVLSVTVSDKNENFFDGFEYTKMETLILYYTEGKGPLAKLFHEKDKDLLHEIDVINKNMSEIIRVINENFVYPTQPLLLLDVDLDKHLWTLGNHGGDTLTLVVDLTLSIRTGTEIIEVYLR